MIDSIEKLKMKDKDIVYLINEDNNCRETFKLLRRTFSRYKN